VSRGGVHFIDDGHACCKRPLAAGARFAAGYPITSSTEVVRFVSRIPAVRGTFIQMEEELAASTTVLSSVGGAKSLIPSSSSASVAGNLQLKWTL